MSKVLRPMVPADVDSLMPIQREGAIVGLISIFPQDLYPFPVDAVRDRWNEELVDSSVDCFVVLDDRRGIAGFAAVRGPEFLHFGTAVHTWSSGLAGVAHDDVIDHLRDVGHRRAWLRVFADNTRARRFYERRGWAPTGERTQSTFRPHAALLRYEVDVPPASLT